MTNVLCLAVSRTNLNTRALLGSVSLGVLLAFGSSGARAQSAPILYVTNQSDNTVSAISTSTDTVIATVAGFVQPWGVAVRGDGSLAYVVNLNGGVAPGFVSVLDTATNALTGGSIQVGAGPTAIALTPNGSAAYVTNENSNTVSVINTATNTVTTTIPVGINPFLVAVSPNGAAVYVSNNSYTSSSNGSISVISTATNTVIATIALGSSDPAGLTVSPDGSRLYVTTTSNVTVINTATNAVSATINIANSQAIALSSNGSTAYVLSGSSIYVVNTATNSVTANISLGASAIEVALSPDGTALYVAELNANAIAVINTATNTIATTVPAGAQPLYPAVCSNGNALLAAGLTFKANNSGALACTLGSGAAGPIFTGGTLQFAGANISSALPVTLMSQGGTFDTNGNNATLSGAISGSGGLTKIGAGMLTLSGAGSYSGATNIIAGTLQAGAANVLSSNSAFAIASGASLDLNGFNQTIHGLSGIGAVVNSSGALPTLTMASGGILAPGNGVPGASMAIAANLAFQSGAIYLVQVNPSTASLARIAGSAALDGAAVNANFATGDYVAKQYTILTAANGISGTFGGVVNTGLSPVFATSLSYDSEDVFLNVKLNLATAAGNTNQQAVGNALTNFFNANGGIPVIYAGLTSNGLTQVSGETATGSQQTTFDAMTQFMNLMTDPHSAGRGDPAGATGGASGYANEDSPLGYAAKRNPADALAAIYTKARPVAFEPRWSSWIAGFGGAQTTDGNATVGSNSTTSRVYGTAVGADYRFSPFTIAGFSLAGGGTSFGVANGGSGQSDLFQAGAFIRHSEGAAYISGALAYGWQDITTDRTVSAAGIDLLRAEFNANTFSGRAEGGYRYVSPWTGGIGITPYAAAQFTTFDLPSYAESVVSGAANFALAYAARDVTDSRSELGIRTDKSFPVQDAVLTLRGRLAWAHDYDPDRAVSATFQALPGASFVVNGAAQASDSALTTAAAELKWTNNWTVAATFEGEFSNVTSSYAGKGVVRYAW